MKMLNNSFKGFPKEMPTFLFELRFHNTIEDQAENVEKYKKLIIEPLRLLYGALIPTITSLDYPFDIKPARCISTPYTDRRYFPSAPLKEYMYIRFKQFGKDENVPGLYFDMGAQHYSYGLRIYKQTTDGIKKLREKIFERPEFYSDQLYQVIADGFSVHGELYKRDHHPKLPDCRAKEILNRKYFHIGKIRPVHDNVFTSNLAKEIAEGFVSVSKILDMMGI